jgi:hypothetical protein
MVYRVVVRSPCTVSVKPSDMVPHVAAHKAHQRLWLPAGRLQSPDVLRCGRSAVTAAGDGDPASNSVQLVAAPVTVRGSPDRRRPSGKAARYIERLALL